MRSVRFEFSRKQRRRLARNCLSVRTGHNGAGDGAWLDPDVIEVYESRGNGVRGRTGIDETVTVGLIRQFERVYRFVLEPVLGGRVTA